MWLLVCITCLSFVEKIKWDREKKGDESISLVKFNCTVFQRRWCFYKCTTFALLWDRQTLFQVMSSKKCWALSMHWFTVAFLAFKEWNGNNPAAYRAQAPRRKNTPDVKKCVATWWLTGFPRRRRWSKALPTWMFFSSFIIAGPRFEINSNVHQTIRVNDVILKMCKQLHEQRTLSTAHVPSSTSCAHNELSRLLLSAAVPPCCCLSWSTRVFSAN